MSTTPGRTRRSSGFASSAGGKTPRPFRPFHVSTQFDPDFEFSAPKFCDFSEIQNDDVHADKWFDASDGADGEGEIEGVVNDFVVRSGTPRRPQVELFDFSDNSAMDVDHGSNMMETSQDEINSSTQSQYLQNSSSSTSSSFRPRAHSSYAHFAVKSLKALTLPGEYTFAKPTKAFMNHQLEAHKESEDIERKTAQIAEKARRDPQSVPVPAVAFKATTAALAASAAASSNASSSPYVPLAMKVKQFEKTPQRFKSRQSVKLHPSVAAIRSHGLTQPKSPMLQTKLRRRPTMHIPSQAEREMEELAKIKPFKARPVNFAVLYSGGDLGVPKVEKPELTHPVDVRLNTDARIMSRPKKETPEPEALFHAKPVPREIFEHVIGVPEKKEFPLTVPQSPAITKILKRKTSVAFGNEEKPKPKPLANIQVGPFELPGDEISRRKRQRLEEKLRHEEEQAKSLRDFHAHHVHLPEKVVVGSNQPFVPKHVEPKVTQPRPFQLQTEARGMMHAQKMEEQFYEEIEKENAQRAFHAQPVLKTSPFLPKKSTKVLTVTEPIKLATSERAVDRSAYDAWRKKFEEAGEAARLADKQRRQEEEERRAQELRKQSVHHAQPIRQFAPIKIRPSERPLTEPISPYIGKKRRLASHTQSRLAHQITDDSF